MSKHEVLLDAFKGMTLLELSEFVKEFEHTFGVTAAQPMTQMVLTELPPEPEVEEQTEFTVILEAVGEKKIQVIKEVRSLTKLGLSDAKALVENLPHTVLENVDKDRALEAQALLVKAGATVTLQ